MSKSLNILIIMTLVVVVLGVVRVVIGGPEDAWICDNGQWVKHGAPSAPMPSEACK